MSDSIEVVDKKTDMRDTKRMLVGWPAVGYNSADASVHKFYEKESGQVTKDKSWFYKKKLTDIFIFSMALGKNRETWEPYPEEGGRAPTINIEYFGSQEKYIWLMIAAALEKYDRDLTIFENPKIIIDLCESYANYGIHKLIDIEEDSDKTNQFKGYEELFEETIKKLKEEELKQNEMSNM